MKIDSIQSGIVPDHIKAGKSMQIYKYLGLDDLDCSVAIIKYSSSKMGKKDIIKIADNMDLNLDVLGYIDRIFTVCYIRDGKIVEKKHLELPERIVNIVRCKNPRCITSVEQDFEQVFKLTDRENRIYRCAYCESKKVNINLEESKGSGARNMQPLSSCDDLVYNYSTFILLYLMRSVVRKQWRPRNKS